MVVSKYAHWNNLENIHRQWEYGVSLQHIELQIRSSQRIKNLIKGSEFIGFDSKVFCTVDSLGQAVY
eukprot:3641911-Amphidinium_carterae.1